MKTRTLIFGFLFSSLLGGVISLAGYILFVEKKDFQSFEQNQNALFARYYADTTQQAVPQGLNFIAASNIVRPCVVHVKTTYESTDWYGRSNPHSNDPLFRFFFEDPMQPDMDPRRSPKQKSSGSGVVIAPDGYIVTNNHVIEGASKIEVVLDDKRTYTARLVGRDAETDLALLKIEEKNLPFLKFGNSETVKVGEWVLACGNPFDLTSTITAGIVSAKGRNINLLRSKENYAIESFIQTDAAVNPGNSGGALVNLKGELIGINTAIASPTGAYSGYSFAVPVTIVKKVMDDLLNFGEVQRALLGVMIQDITDQLAKDNGLKDIKGVYITGVNEGSAAKDAGLEKGDVILKINSVEVNSTSELQEAVAQFRPGEKVSVTYSRSGKTYTKTIALKNKKGTFSAVKSRTTQVVEDLGAELETVDASTKDKLKIEHGVKVVKLLQGKLKDAGVRGGFVIQFIDKNKVNSPDDVVNLLEDKSGGILIEGVYPDGTKAYYAIGW